MNDHLLKTLKVEFREFCSTYSHIAEIDHIFTIAGFSKANSSIATNGQRRSLVEGYYASVDWSQSETFNKFLRVIECSLIFHYLSGEAKARLLSICHDCGIKFEDDGYRICYENITNSFSYQFPAGLPFGVIKPEFAIKADKGGQLLKFELQSGIGIIEPSCNVYPNFDFNKLETSYELNSSTSLRLKQSLRDMNQTEYEKNFFLSYAHKFDMGNKSVPVLIPQAWIQWHSVAKKNLRSTSSLHKDQIYRVDFVAFWNNKRYVILVDDISHYAIKDNKWIASEEAYAKRLKEDRKLRKEGWEVFRVSNWEIRNDKKMQDDRKTQEILEDLRTFIGF
jgi:hypothetical protein